MASAANPFASRGEGCNELGACARACSRKWFGQTWCRRSPAVDSPPKRGHSGDTAPRPRPRWSARIRAAHRSRLGRLRGGINKRSGSANLRRHGSLGCRTAERAFGGDRDVAPGVVRNGISDREAQAILPRMEALLDPFKIATETPPVQSPDIPKPPPTRSISPVECVLATDKLSSHRIACWGTSEGSSCNGHQPGQEDRVSAPL